MRRACIIVSPYFPPSTLAGVHRARHLAKHLPAAGWWPIVLCVNEAHHEERLDPDLASLVPPSVEIVKVGALPARITRRFGVGDISLRAHGHLRQALFRLLAARPVDAVLITGSPYFPMLLAPEIRRRLGPPVVLDFQDPWVSTSGARQPPLSKAGLSHWLATKLEPHALCAAAYVTSVSDTQNAELGARHLWLDRSRMAGIPIGGDPEDFAALRSNLAAGDLEANEPGTISFSYVGTIWPAVIPTLRTLLRAVARLRDAAPALYARLRLTFAGTTANPNDTTGYLVRPLAEQEGVADAVHEIPQRLPYLQALAIMAHSDVILMIGSDEPHYTASKIYPGLMSGRPFLSLFHRASSAHEILLKAGGGVAFGFADQAQLAALETSLADALVKLVTMPETLGRVDPAAYAPYEARAIAQRFAAIFDNVAARPG